MIFAPKFKEISVGQRGTNVVISLPDGTGISIPFQQALELSKAISHKAKVSETYNRMLSDKDREQLIKDQELILKAGMCLNLGVPRPMLETIGPVPEHKRGKVGAPTIIDVKSVSSSESVKGLG